LAIPAKSPVAQATDDTRMRSVSAENEGQGQRGNRRVPSIPLAGARQGDHQLGAKTTARRMTASICGAEGTPV